MLAKCTVVVMVLAADLATVTSSHVWYVVSGDVTHTHPFNGPFLGLPG